MTRTVVVGGGAAGAALAARLSSDPDRDVTLVEAGSADGDYPADLLDGSSVRGAMPGHPANWSYLGHLTPELAYTVARGRILGGSSTINGGYFVRARRGDLDAWARTAGPEWSYDGTLPIWRELERDHDYGDTAEHGGSGPMPVRRPPASNPATEAFLAAAQELGFGYEADKNGDGRPGVGPVPANVIDGVRVNTGIAYIEPARSRPNLTVIGRTRAHRVQFEGTRARGVESDHGFIGADEIVLCAGAIGSAQLLLVSGIGPRAPLEALGIRVVSDLPVGESFSDHPDIAVGWRATRQIMDPAEGMAFPAALNFDSSGDARRHPDGDLEILLSVKTLGHLLTGSGRAAARAVAAAVRHPIRVTRAVTGISARRAAAQLATRNDLQLLVGLHAPTGRGVLSLQSGDPRHPPRIDYRYLAEADDRARMRTGIRRAVSLLQTAAFDDLFGGLTELDERALEDDEALDAWALSHLGTAIHMSGTAPVGPVVDGAGRVHGVTGLRVVDTSILPVVPSRGPFATAVLLGEMLGRRMRDGG